MLNSDYIVVRDRRQRHQFSVHNRIVDEWYPIIGKPGFILYSLYVRMSNKDDERCYPGYTLIAKHLGMGSATISNYNQLLVWCGLIHIVPGDETKPNDYYILDVPSVTPEALQAIREQATANFSPKSTFLKALLKRLDNWQPIQAHWNKYNKDKPILVHPAQLSLLDDRQLEGTTGEGHESEDEESEGDGNQGDESEENEGGTFPGKVPTPPGEHPTFPGKVGTSPGEQGTSPGEHPTFPRKEKQSETTIRNNNPKEQSTTTTHAPTSAAQDASPVGVVGLLSSFDIQEPHLSTIAGNGTDLATAQAWIWYAQAQDNLTTPTGFVVDRLLNSVPPPPDLLSLARAVQQLTPEEMAILHDRARERRSHGPKYVWWPLLHGEERNERLAEVFDDWETLELWYSHTYPDDTRKPTSHTGGDVWRKPPAEEIDPEVRAKQRKALAEHRARRERERAPPGGDTVIANDLTAAQVWETALDELALQMTEATHAAWLQDFRLARYEDDVFTVGVKNKYAEDWLENRLRATIERTVARLAGRPVQIRFEASA